jgi:hypothetical protein
MSSADRRFRILVLGGSGVFGSRLCRLLADDPALELILAGRDSARAKAETRRLRRDGARATLMAHAMDLTHGMDAALAKLRPALVVHTAGPFQGQDHAVAESCVRRGVHYIDLADSAAFAIGIATLDAAARKAGVRLASGASTAPALSGAVIDSVRSRFASIARIAVAIAPGNRAPRGPALVEAILDTTGRPLPARPGMPAIYGWQGLRHVAMPGIGRRFLSHVDLPDRLLFPDRYGVAVVEARAGLELAILHLGPWLLSWLPRAGLVRSLKPLAAPLRRLADLLIGFGSDRGGMTVEIEGRGVDGQPLALRWSLIGEAGHGPFVPVAAAAALARRLAAGKPVPAGAGACLGLLTLDEIMAELSGLAICAGWDSAGFVPSLYRRTLGRRYEALCPAGQRLHDAGSSRFDGTCDIDGADTRIGRALARLLKFPRSGRDVPLQVEFVCRDGREEWLRRFPDTVLRSQQYLGSGRWAGALVERFGALSFRLGTHVDGGRLVLSLEGARVLGLPLPRWLRPRVVASEAGDEHTHVFDVAIALPLVGRLVRYRGRLDVADADAPVAACEARPLHQPAG